MERFCGMSDVEMLGIIESEWGYRLPRITKHASPKLLMLIAREPWSLLLTSTSRLTVSILPTCVVPSYDN
jgi:hypothetical protein